MCVCVCGGGGGVGVCVYTIAYDTTDVTEIVIRKVYHGNNLTCSI